jgi:hypothetical protein
MSKSKLINIRIDEVLLNQFNDYCTDNNTNKSEFLINAIKQALSSNQSVNNAVNTTIDYNVNTDVKTDSKPFDIKEIETLISDIISEKLEGLNLTENITNAIYQNEIKPLNEKINNVFSYYDTHIESHLISRLDQEIKPLKENLIAITDSQENKLNEINIKLDKLEKTQSFPIPDTNNKLNLPDSISKDKEVVKLPKPLHDKEKLIDLMINIGLRDNFLSDSHRADFDPFYYLIMIDSRDILKDNLYHLTRFFKIKTTSKDTKENLIEKLKDYLKLSYPEKYQKACQDYKKGSNY